MHTSLNFMKNLPSLFQQLITIMAQEADQDMPEYKIILVGHGGVGKSSFAMRFSTGYFRTEYVATIGYEVYVVVVHTNIGPLKFNLWDIPGQEKCGSLCLKYYKKANAAIIMCDVTSRATSINVTNWYRDICAREGDTSPIIVITGNKVDIKDRKLEEKHMSIIKKKKLQYYEISVKKGINIEEPFLYLARKLTGDDTLHFVEDPALQPPAELAVAREMPPPEDDEDL